MRRILHISDLHFGRLHPPALESLRQFISEQEQSLNLVVVTGDWTQRARRKQFEAAEQFLRDIRVPVLSVPGNHDVPLYDLWTRFLFPFRRYERHIGRRSVSEFVTDTFAIFGISTVNIYRPVQGKAHAREFTRARNFFAAQDPRLTRILAVHHPLPREVYRDLHVDAVLSGHEHESGAEQQRLGSGRTLLHVVAGTAVSSRFREEVNNFNILTVGSGKLKIETFDLGAEGFVAREAEANSFTVGRPS